MLRQDIVASADPMKPVFSLSEFGGNPGELGKDAMGSGRSQGEARSRSLNVADKDFIIEICESGRVRPIPFAR